MNDIEQLLSDTADYVQQRLDADVGLGNLLEAALRNGQSPGVVRLINGLPIAELVIAFRNRLPADTA